MPDNPTKDKRRRYIILLTGLIIVLCSFYLRITVVTNSVVVHPVRADARDYFLYAYNLKKFNIYSRSDAGIKNISAPKPDALRSPGFPLMASIFIDEPLTDSALKKTLFTNVVLSVLTVFIIFLVASFMMPLPYAVAVGILTSISPHLVNTNIYFLSETLSTFLICTFVCIFYLACVYKKYSLWFLVGFILGAAMLVRPFIQYFVIFLVMLIFISPLVVEKIRISLIILLGFLLLVAPWSIRNYHHFGYVSDDTLVINTLVHGMYPDFMFQGKPESFGSPYHYDPRSEAVSASLGTVLDEIKVRFSEKTIEHLHWYLMGKPLYLWSWNIVQGQGDAFIYPVQQSPYYENQLFQATHALSKYSHIWCVIFAALASILIWVKKSSVIPDLHTSAGCTFRLVSILLIYTTMLHMVGTPLPRYSIPLRPEVYLMTCLFIFWMASTILSKKNYLFTQK